MKGVMRIQVARRVHSLAATSSESQLKKVKSHISSYHESTDDPKRKNKYLGLLRNIYHIIPSRFNETEVWEHFLTALKQERCFAKLKSLVRRNSLVYPPLLCRQIVFLYYIGLDEEANRLLHHLTRKLAKREADMSQEGNAKVNEEMGDVIKMLYVLYHLRKTKQNYKEVVLLCDKYICNTRRDPLNNLRYLLYFHLFYAQMNHSFGKMHRCIEICKHRIGVEQMMFLIRYVNQFLKRLYLSGVILHRGDLSGGVAVRKGELSPEEATHTVGSHPPCYGKKEVHEKVQNELEIFLGNLLRINKNEKDHYVFSSFDDVVLHRGRRDGRGEPPPASSYQPERSSLRRRDSLLGGGGKTFHDGEDPDGGPSWERGDPPLMDTHLVKPPRVTERDLLMYRDIYAACTGEVMKRVLICKESLQADALWNNFLSSMFRDNFAHFVLNQMKGKMKILKEEHLFTFLKQVKLLRLEAHPSVSTTLQVFFKQYSNVQMKSLDNFLIADKMTYYTDLFCECPFVQKYILNMYRQNLNSFNVKILKKIVAKLFYFLKREKPLINGFDVLIKNIFVKVAVSGSLSDIVMVLHTLRQYNFYKHGVNRGHSRGRAPWGGEPYDGIALHDEVAPPWGVSTLAYDEVKKKMLSFFAPICAADNCEGGEVGPTRGGDRLDGLFHVSAPRLDYITGGDVSGGGSEYHCIREHHSVCEHHRRYHRRYHHRYHHRCLHPVCEYLLYRSVIEKVRLGGRLRHDKYVDPNGILMLSKQLAKRFSLFVRRFFSAARSGGSPLHVFDCVNDGVERGLHRVEEKGAQGRDQLGDSGSSPCEEAFPFGDALSVRSSTEEKLGIPSRELHTYAQKHPEEYTTVKRFGDLLLLTLIDNLLYFELKGSHFIRFFLRLFEENSWPLCAYHHFFFYKIFKSFRYSQVSARDRRCVPDRGGIPDRRGIWEGDGHAEDAVAGYLSSEETFERRRRQIVGICRAEVMRVIRRGLRVQGGDSTNEVSVRAVGQASGGPDVDCLINLAFCHLQEEDIIDLFRGAVLPSLNDCLKWKGTDAVVMYALARDPSEGTCSKGESPRGRSDHHHNSTIRCNDFAKIRSLLNANGDNQKRQVQSAEVLRRYEFFYLNMMSRGRGSDALEDPFPTREDYLCYADFLFHRREGCSAQDLLRLARGVHKYGPCNQVGSLLKSIQTAWSSHVHTDSRVSLYVDSEISGTVNLITFHVSYLLLLTAFMKKIVLEDVAPALSQIDSELANGADVSPFWRLLLVQLLYVLKIQGLFSFDLLCSKYRQVTHLYNRSIGQMRKERQRSGSSTLCPRYGDYIWTDKIVKYLQNQKVPFEEGVQLVDSPFTFDVYVPSMNLFLLNGEKSPFCDAFVRCLQDSLFGHMGSKVVRVHEGCYHWLVRGW
ncbi:hypothetical protein PVMG_01045 [Plasmodium vivax Mauritania I]|uniref:Uncharacterized protein n=1 Tax=Plasmodium vivax Mauritania I TaxID=1035515 RepID=A0A0J9TEI3_PLAVI|nr:hypothetical protein PVMG_01045 [Plasmodium vivax Mauritania I]